VRLESSDDLRSVYLSANKTTVVYQSDTLITFTFPMSVFVQQDFVKVSLSFGEDKYFLANDRLFVYAPIVLVKPRPLSIYT
jgi:hypothetical protein